MFTRLTKYTENFAHHRHTKLWLFFYAVIESVFFPVPPDVLLVPLALTRPKRALQFATIAAFGSAVGGLIGYAIGRFGFETLATPILNWFCQYNDGLCPQSLMPRIQNLFSQHGYWIVAISAFSPVIPYRFMILGAGLGQMAIVPFFMISIGVHWCRYALVSWLVARYGQAAMIWVKQRLPLAFAGAGVVALVLYGLFAYL